MKKVTIHQPQYIPWVPYFDKILQCEVFIFLDNVQFQKNGLQNRNWIKNPQGPQWLTIPVKHRFGQLICETRIADQKALSKHLKTIEINYKKAPCFDKIFPLISETFSHTQENLSQLCCDLIVKFLNYLGYKGQIYKNSELRVKGKGSELVLNICREIKADTYFSGQGGKNYLDLEAFAECGIRVEFQNYKEQRYSQCFPKAGFCPGVSIVDLLFNKGKESLAIIKKGRIVEGNMTA